MRWGEGGNDGDSAVPSWSLGSYDLGVIIVGSVKSMHGTTYRVYHFEAVQ